MFLVKMSEEIKKHILKKFMYNGSLRFNEILDKAYPSNKFNYHLKLLIDEKIITKKNDKYSLTSKGTQVISSMDGVQIEEKRKPITCVFILGYDEQKNKLVLNQRKKQPFLNFIGLPGGKIEYGHSLPEQAREEFLEETGLDAEKFELKLITNYRTIDEETQELTHHVIGFFYLATGLKGKLIQKTREGENMFVTLKETKNMKKYPDFEFFTKILLSKSKQIKFREANRYTKNGEFTKIEFL